MGDDNDGPDLTGLVAAAIGGDEAAWVALVRRYTPLARSVMSSYRVFGADAEDVGQIVWLRLIEHLSELRQPRALPMWVITTTRNECIRHLRASRRAEPFEPQAERLAADVETTGVDEALLRSERRLALLEAIAELPDHQRNLLLLLVEDPPLPYSEISRRLGIAVGSIGPTRARALRRLGSSPALAALFVQAPAPDSRGGGRRDIAAMDSR
jgi:RNA polymerase sigma factor (sigma-70 family)